VVRSLRPSGPNEVQAETVAGQYTSGAVGAKVVPGYIDELGHASRTETFVALRAHIDNWRWSGVPFYLRTGKRMARRSTEIHLQLKSVPHSIFDPGAHIAPNALTIRLQPDERIELKVMSKTPGLDRAGMRLSEVELDLDMHEEFADSTRRPAYERLYMDALEGNGTLFVRRDETEAAWEWVDAILDGWRQADVRPRPYPAGTWGPASAIAMTERHGHTWRE
jgi:glucose-6-phosphate 1-dehydrogenase